MEELLLPPKHSLSSPSLRAEERSESRRKRRRRVYGEKRRWKGKIEEWYSKKEQKRERKREKQEWGTGSMYGVDTRLLREFESEDVDLAGSSYLAHILKLGTSTIYSLVRADNSGV